LNNFSLKINFIKKSPIFLSRKNLDIDITFFEILFELSRVSSK